MNRFVLDISYKGTNYHGYQIQENAITVQEVLEKGIFTLLRVVPPTYSAGRTDTGVHARQMYVHFDFEEELHPKFFASLNMILPRDISITKIYRAVKPDFNARFDAVSRSYMYRLLKHKNALEADSGYFFPKPLDFESMKAAAPILMEYNSFECFCKTRGSNKTFLCDIYESAWEEEPDAYIFRIKANRFLRGMVRAILGTLIMVGKGEIDLAGFRKVIESKDRANAGISVDAQGLFLMEVGYPDGLMEELDHFV